MQLFAFNKKNHLISATQAERKVNYFCRECGHLVRLRGGIHTQLHFYHLSSTSSCRLSQKSIIHIQIQNYLQSLLPLEEAVLERQFTEIGRIADLVWEPQKLVFEIQCSPISKEEVESRNNDYKSLGYKVIWIFHENRFNRWKASAAEIFLRNSPHYYTNIDRRGKGCIYDQIDVINGGIRRTFRRLMDVKLNHPRERKLAKITDFPLIPEILLNRLASWPLYFSDDLIDLWLRKDTLDGEFLLQVYQYEKSIYKNAMHPFLAYLKMGFQWIVLRPYKLFFQMILEKSCK